MCRNHKKKMIKLKTQGNNVRKNQCTKWLVRYLIILLPLVVTISWRWLVMGFLLLCCFFVHTKIAANHAHTFSFHFHEKKNEREKNPIHNSSFMLLANVQKVYSHMLIHAVCINMIKLFRFKLLLSSFCLSLFCLNQNDSGISTNSHQKHSCRHTFYLCVPSNTQRKWDEIFTCKFIYSYFLFHFNENTHTHSPAIIEPKVNFINPIHVWRINHYDLLHEYNEFVIFLLFFFVQS